MPTDGRVERRSLLVAAMGVAVLGHSGLSHASTLTGVLEAAILGKALSYAQTLKTGKANVLIVTQDGGAGTQQLADAFRKVGATVKVTTPAAVDAPLAGWADAAYVPPGQLTTAIRDLCTAQRMLSMSGSVGDVEAGRAGMAVGVNADKPQLVVNLGRIAAEGHKFSARLLKLARIVG